MIKIDIRDDFEKRLNFDDETLDFCQLLRQNDVIPLESYDGQTDAS